MGDRASNEVKRPRPQQIEEEHAELAPLHLTAHPTLPLPLLALSVAQSLLGMCVFVQLCGTQGAAQFPFVRLPPRVRRPFAGAPLHNMSLTHAELLRVLGCGFKGKLVRLLSLGTGHYFEPDRNWRTCHKLMNCKVRRVAAKLMHSVAAAVGNKVGQEAEELCASGQYATAVVALKLAVDLGHLPSRALLAYIIQQGRVGVAEDSAISMMKSIELVEEGARLGCHHCQGMMAFCHMIGYGCVRDEVRSLELARESAEKGSRYGQFYLGYSFEKGRQGLDALDPFSCFRKKGPKIKQDVAEAARLYRLAAAQGHDIAQNNLACMLADGRGVAQDTAESARLYRLAAAQGNQAAQVELGVLFMEGKVFQRDDAEAVRLFRLSAAQNDHGAQYLMGQMVEQGRGAALDMAEAIRWYRLAGAQRNKGANEALRRLNAFP
jgi:TPR repeat protein